MAIIYQNDKLEEISGINFLLHEVGEEEVPHGHEFMEIEFVVSGEVTQCINGQIYECAKNDFLFFYPGDTHSFTPHGEAVLLNLVFNPQLFNEMKLNKFFPIDKRIASMVNLPQKERTKLIKLFYIMKEEFDGKADGYVYILHNLLRSLVCCLLRYGYKDKKQDMRIQKIIELLKEDCTLGITEIAQKCGLCNNHLCKIFKQKTGVALKDYINQQRIQKAYHLVQTTDMSMESIMAEIGVWSKTHFYELFRKFIGRNPGEIRNDMAP